MLFYHNTGKLKQISSLRIWSNKHPALVMDVVSKFPFELVLKVGFIFLFGYSSPAAAFPHTDQLSSQIFFSSLFLIDSFGTKHNSNDVKHHEGRRCQCGFLR